MCMNYKIDDLIDNFKAYLVAKGYAREQLN